MNQAPNLKGQHQTGRRWMLASTSLLLTSLVLASCGGSNHKERVVLITLDTLRYDSLMGSEEHQGSMDQVRQFTEKAQSFTNFYSATSTTQPTHASLFTGLHPWQTGVHRNGCHLVGSHETLAEILQNEKFETAAVVSSFPVHSKFGFDQGFNTYDDDFTIGLGVNDWEGAKVENDRFYSLASTVTERALDQISASKADRQFFWFHYFDAHSPYGDTGKTVVDLPDILNLARAQHPNLKKMIGEARKLYDADVSSMDRALGRLLNRLLQDEEKHGIRTHIILTADHGESFGESGSFGHGKRLTMEQVRVPLLLYSPDLAPGVRDDVAGSIDVPSTILALVNAKPLGRGRDLTTPDKEGKAFGMRRMFLQPYQDTRLSGRTVTISGSHFYTVQGGTLYAGNHTQIREGDISKGKVDGGIAESIKKLFQAFDQELQQDETKDTMTDADRKALEELGYTQ